jgi:serine/threonine-protein kinase HipA
MALPLRGKKSHLTRHDLVDYFARERLQINERTLADVLTRFERAVPVWRQLLEKSFLSREMKNKFLSAIEERTQRLHH